VKCSRRRDQLAGVLGLSALAVGTSNTQDATANGDLRSLTVFHTHTQESATITFRRNGQYDPAGLKQLNWILRDWRNDQTTNMDPRLFDTLWAVYREVGSREPINIVSAYRSPQTNAMLHRRSKAVSEQSQHMSGKAMDIRLPDIPTSRLRETAMRLQGGGVGYYSAERFVHIDVGNVRAWPRMSRTELAGLFPDGKTVHLPSRGGPLPGYELARTEILARGGGVGREVGTEVAASPRRSLWAMLFGKDDANQAEPLASTSVPRMATHPVSEIAAAASRVQPPLPPIREVPVDQQRIDPAGLSSTGAAEATAPDEALSVGQLFGAGEIARIGFSDSARRPGGEMLLALAPSRLSIGFSAAAHEGLSPEKFTGPAVAPLPLIR
jgi:uncharacterized protein YcbK (DUF882 family)